MEFEVLASPDLSERAAFWRATADQVLSEGGFAPSVSRVHLTDRPAAVPGFEEIGPRMESVALALPRIAPQVPLVIDIVESDKLLQGDENQKLAVATAIVREEGFHARDFAALSKAPRERWAEHVDAEGNLLNSHGLHSMLELRVLEDHVARLAEREEWFLVHYKVPWAKHVWNGLRNRMLVFRKRHGDLAWVEANVGGLQELFFRFSETFVPLLRRIPTHPEVAAITRFAEWNRVQAAVADFEKLFEDGFRVLPEDGSALSGFSLSARMQEDVLTPWLQKLSS
jgi:hypothetical protein